MVRVVRATVAKHLGVDACSARACGFEAAVAAMVVKEDILPPTINHETPDPDCDLDYVPNKPREVKGVRHMMSNSFGFGGTNATLIFSKYET